MARRLQRDDNVYEQNLDSVGKISEDEEEEQYHKESLFYYIDDGEDTNVVIGDEPIFDEEDENDVEYVDFIGIDKVFFLYSLNFYFEGITC